VYGHSSASRHQRVRPALASHANAASHAGSKLMPAALDDPALTRAGWVRMLAACDWNPTPWCPDAGSKCGVPDMMGKTLVTLK
jgi:hypothetical protein